MGSGLFGRLEQELDAREKTPGLSMSQVLTMSDSQRRLVSWMVRERQVELSAAAAYMGQEEGAIRGILDEMVEQGYAITWEAQNQTFYRVRLASKRGRDIPLDIWECLDDKCEL